MMNSGDAPFGMTDLEERLNGPDAALVKTDLLSRLSQVATELDAMVVIGLRPDDFARATAVKAAIVTARGILAGNY